jgi:hypothetical protein
MPAALFGPNTKLIDDLMRHLGSLPWFSRIETPHPEDDRTREAVNGSLKSA